jgi:two-component system, cell cycle response regulator
VGSFEDEKTPVTHSMVFGGPTPKLPCLVRLTGSQLGEVLLIEGELFVGREREHGISMPHDVGVSRVHAKIVALDGGGALLVDLGSTNGTFVDGVRVKEKLLIEGDKIRVGQSTVLKFQRFDDAELKMQRRLVDEALRDGMTRVFNRRYFMERVESELGYASRHGVPVSVVLFDLDHFKEVNDVYGHLAGDQVLCALAAVCARTVRNEDVLARYGGEEFIVLLRGIVQEGALRLAERLRRGVELAELGSGLAPPRAITVSVGVATFRADDFPPLETARERLIATADAALYRAKHAGRNVVAS